MTETDNRTLQQAQRAKYMGKELSHQDYYIWLSNFIGIKCPQFLIEAAKLSNDEHYNDVPLGQWDRQDPWVRQAAYNKGLAWALSDTVCCLKALARASIAK